MRRDRRPMKIQTLVFSKTCFRRAGAVAWAEKHDFQSDDVDETKASYRLRQADPDEFDPRTFRTIALPRHRWGGGCVKAVVAKRRRGSR